MVRISICLLCTAVASSASARTINVKLTAPWPSTALAPIQEVAEFMAEESHREFWNFVEGLRDVSADRRAFIGDIENDSYSEKKHEEMASLAVELAAPLVSSLQLSALRLTLAVRSFAPLIEAHRSLAEMSSHVCRGLSRVSPATVLPLLGDSWAVLSPSGRIVCDPSELVRAATAWCGAGASPCLWPVTRDHGVEEPVQEVDHIYGTRTEVNGGRADGGHHFNYDGAPYTPQARATLYGRLGSPLFWEFHDELVTLASGGVIGEYVFRHAVPPTYRMPEVATTVALQGYGVNLDIKNMEYMNLDDGGGNEPQTATNHVGANTKDGPVLEGGDLDGLKLSTILHRRPDVGSKLRKLHLLLEKDRSNTAAGDMKAWKLRDLGLQATASILAAKDPLRRLMDVAQNFPNEAAALSMLRVPPAVRSEVESNTNSMIFRQGLLGAGSSALFVNGRVVNIDLNTFNIFSLLRTIRVETHQLERLEQLSLPIDTARALLHLGVAGGGNGWQSNDGSRDMRIDVVSGSKGAIQFLNNLEKDPQYKRWPRSLRQLMYPTWSLHTLSRNLYTLISVLDPTTEDGLVALRAIESLHKNSYPVRFGIVLTSKTILSSGTTGGSMLYLSQQAGGEGERCATVTDVVALFTQAKIAHSVAVAFAFIFSAAVELEVGYTVRELIESYAAAVSTAKKSWTKSSFENEAKKAIQALYYPGSHPAPVSGNRLQRDTLGMISNMTDFVIEKGIPLNSYIMNGQLDKHMDYQQGLMQLLAQEQRLLQQMLEEGKLGASEAARSVGGKPGNKGKPKSVLSQILINSPFLVKKYHPLLAQPPEKVIYFVPSMAFARTLHYVHTPGTRATALKYVSLVLVDDWALPGAIDRLQHALSFLEAGPDLKVAESTRFSAVYNPSCSHRKPNVMALTVQAIFDAVSIYSSSAGRWADENSLVTAVPFLRIIIAQLKTTGKLDVAGAAKVCALSEEMTSVVTAAATKVSSFVGDEDGLRDLLPTTADTIFKQIGASGEVGIARMVIANGRCVVLESDTEVFTANDYELVVDQEIKHRAADVERIIRAAEIDASAVSLSASNPLYEGDWRSDAVAVTSAFLGQYTQTSREDVESGLRHLSTEASYYGMSGSEDNEATPQEGGRSNNRRNAPILNANGTDENSTAVAGGRASVGTVSVTVVLDPLTEAAQRVAPLLLVLRDQLRVPLKLLLLPRLDITEFPLQKFYRYVVGADVGDVKPSAVFEGLPRQHVLTMRMDVPEPWNVQSIEALQDVDNLRCSDATCGDPVVANDLTTIEYTLKSLAAAGQCFDIVEGRPPNGLQIALWRVGANGKEENGDDIRGRSLNNADTLVMQNLGYFQLHANPGIWRLGLAEGRGFELFEILSPPNEQIPSTPRSEAGGTQQGETEGGSGDNVAEKVDVEGVERAVSSQSLVVTTFYDVTNQLRVRKRPGKEDAQLLQDIDLGGDFGSSGDENDHAEVDVDVDSGSWGPIFGDIFRGGGEKISSFIIGDRNGTSKNARGEKLQGETVHVFSLATGHLYERFLKIMMLSVHKRCSLPVKFWLFENFLSPTFKESAQAMALAYNFDVAFVTYKWPSWLRQQTQKQRIIWGYKILFLDVLFPLNVSKVIYVDSDQTVRGDLAELWRMDIKGKPYAYVPFCSSRKETLGYQFWRTGYWKDHLRGRPYHISALYVVDLVAFRRMAVGDQLRALYDNLSRDPNSLANLDQDLPNYAQNMIPIFSLPTEWLWCESWCSDKTKAKAKTIDLCNNPMHKEPKLDMAKRVISGPLFRESWTELDNEIRELETAARRERTNK